MTKRKLISAFCMLIAMCMSLVAVSYSWLRRDWRPKFEENNIQIQTGSTLAIRLISGQQLATITLNDILHSPEEFRLKQVSNFTGRSEDFFNLSFEKGLTIEDATIQHINVDDDTYENNTLRGEHYGYVEISFFLIGQTNSYEKTQYVFLDNLSHISVPENINEDLRPAYENLIRAIRVSITVHGVGTGSGEGAQDGQTVGIYLDENRGHTGINNKKNPDGTYMASGKSPMDKFIEGDEQLVKPNLDFQPLSYYTAALSEDGVSFDSSRALFQMSSSETRRVTLRIWLEGTDDYCTNEISGLNFDIAIVFAGFDMDNANVGGDATT